ncbi:MAG: thymidine phosphorylase [Deltaproteobacteria bacterium]|nr:thymidine phosphorylase [Deltaproteobacteria bacterium]
MTPYELIKRKRDGGTLSPDDIAAFMRAYTLGEIPDYQMSALLMAVFFKGMDSTELGAWTESMLRSGEVLNLSDIPGTKVDKHSTGGVGDKVSLPLAPLAAACGVRVPMISGRGLGHTGGTLDKLESIPGFRVDLDVPTYRRLVRDVGACLIGQTSTLAPADKKLYALRDVTATVDCLPLIASSIMSKKLAEGIDALVLDVKVGSGAFMKKPEDARALATTMVGIGQAMGKRVTAVLTDMDQPLGRAVGNALEVEESIDVLRGGGPEDLVTVTVELTAEMLLLAGVSKDLEAGRARVRAAIADGSGLRKFEEIVAAQGGDPAAIRDPSKLPRARSVSEVRSASAGVVQAIQCEEVGLAGVELGAGRKKTDDKLDHAVGFTLLKKVGDRVAAGEPLVRVHHNGQKTLGDVEQRLARAYRIGEAAPPVRPLIVERIAAKTTFVERIAG